MTPSNITGTATPWIKRRDIDAVAVRKIMAEVCIKHQVAQSEFLSRVRAARIVKARQEACWRARTETQASFPQIAEVFARHHTSVMYAVDTYAWKLSQRHAGGG